MSRRASHSGDPHMSDEGLLGKFLQLNLKRLTRRFFRTGIDNTTGGREDRLKYRDLGLGAYVIPWRLPVVTITLPSELEKAVAEEAARTGTTAELLTLDVLQERFLRQSSAKRLPKTATGQESAACRGLDAADGPFRGAGILPAAGGRQRRGLVRKSGLPRCRNIRADLGRLIDGQ